MTLLNNEALSRMPKDLGEIAHNLKWAYYDGYLPNAPTAIGASGIISGPDNVPAAKHDFGVGCNRSREVFNDSLRLLGIAEVHIAAALLTYTGGGPLVPLSKPQDHKGKLGPAIKAISMMLARLERLEIFINAGTVYPKPIEHLVNASKAIYECRCKLHKALGESGSQKPAQMCVTCSHRPAETAKYGIRCSPCYHYLRRHGKERPRSLDSGKASMAVVAEAKAKREALGVGYGAG